MGPAGNREVCTIRDHYPTYNWQVSRNGQTVYSSSGGQLVWDGFYDGDRIRCEASYPTYPITYTYPCGQGTCSGTTPRTSISYINVALRPKIPQTGFSISGSTNGISNTSSVYSIVFPSESPTEGIYNYWSLLGQGNLSNTLGLSTSLSFVNPGNYTLQCVSYDLGCAVYNMYDYSRATSLNISVIDPIPTTPTNFRTCGSTASQVCLQWNASTDNTIISNYHLGVNGVYTDVAGTSTQTNVNVIEGQRYRFDLNAIDSYSQNSLVTTLNYLHDVTPPALIPANAISFTYQPSPIALIINWQASTDNIGVTGYQVIRNGTIVATLGNVLSFLDNTFTDETAYTYQIKAFDENNNLSALSGGITIAMDVVAPTSPSGLTANPASSTNNSILLNWQASTDNSGFSPKYLVYRSGISDPIATVSGNQYQVTGLTEGYIYSFSVVAFDNFGNKSFPALIPNLLLDITPPDAPINLRNSSASLRKVVLNWNAATDRPITVFTGILGYNIYKNDSKVNSTVITQTSATLTGMDIFSVEYKVTAIDKAMLESQPSAVLTITAPLLTLDYQHMGVAIGKTEASESLDVDGNVLINSGSLLFKGTPESNKSNIQSEGNLSIQSGTVTGNTYMNVNNGKVGIGTSLPGAKLDVAGDVKVKDNLTVVGTAIINNISVLGLLASNQFIATNSKFTNLTIDGVGKLNEVSANAITTNGIYGISIIKPIADKLTIQGNVRTEGNLSVTGDYLWQNNKNMVMKGAGEWSFDFDDNDGNDFWQVYAPTKGTILSAKNSGEVGIGIANPSAQLHLADVYNPGGKNLEVGDETYFSDIDVANVLGLYSTTSTNEAGLKIGQGGATIYGKDGRIGIGKSPGNEMLDVNGSIRTGGILFSAAFNPDANFYANDNFLSFGHSNISEDFIGYKNNTFFFRDSPGGGDTQQPTVNIGGGLVIGNLAGVGNRMVIADVNGILSSQAVPNASQWSSITGGISYASNVTLGALAGTATRMVIANTNGLLSTQAIPNATQWANVTGGISYGSSITLGGLAGTGNRMVIANTNGVLSTQALPEATQWTTGSGLVSYSGNVAIGNSQVPSGYKLAVDGKVRVKGIRSDPANWSDFVFEPDYELKSLYEVEKQLIKDRHLANMPSEKEVIEQGIDHDIIFSKLLQSIEEDKLYLIQLKKENDDLKKRIEVLENK